MSKFVISLPDTNAAKKNAVTNHFKSKGWAFWHYHDDLWLLKSSSSNDTPKNIFEELTMIIGDDVCLIFEVNGSPKYYGRDDTKSWDWMAVNWGAASN